MALHQVIPGDKLQDRITEELESVVIPLLPTLSAVKGRTVGESLLQQRCIGETVIQQCFRTARSTGSG